MSKRIQKEPCSICGKPTSRNFINAYFCSKKHENAYKGISFSLNLKGGKEKDLLLWSLRNYCEMATTPKLERLMLRDIMSRLPPDGEIRHPVAENGKLRSRCCYCLKSVRTEDVIESASGDLFCSQDCKVKNRNEREERTV